MCDATDAEGLTVCLMMPCVPVYKPRSGAIIHQVCTAQEPWKALSGIEQMDGSLSPCGSRPGVSKLVLTIINVVGARSHRPQAWNQSCWEYLGR